MLGTDYGDYELLCMALEEINTLKARIASFEAEHKWRPISEAPKDGTPILLARPDLISPVTVGYWSMGACDWFCPLWNFPEVKPTHFQPLPKGPKEGI